MKTSPLIALALLLPFARPASADDAPMYSIIRTKSGKVYVNCSVYKSYPDHVILQFENGGANAPFSDLSPEVRDMLGYDPGKAAAYEKGRAERERKKQENLARYRPETARVEATAHGTEAARYQFTGMQGNYGGYAGDGYPYAMGYPYAVGYGMGYSDDNAVNPRYAHNRAVGTRTTSYGNGCGRGLATRGGATFAAPSGTNWIGSNGWNGNSGGHGNPSDGHNSRSRASCGAPPPNVINRPVYNIQTPFRAPAASSVISRFAPAIGSCVRR